MLELGETVFEGVRRELAEETGIEGRVIELIDVFERISLDEADKPRNITSWFSTIFASKSVARRARDPMRWKWLGPRRRNSLNIRSHRRPHA